MLSFGTVAVSHQLCQIGHPCEYPATCSLAEEIAHTFARVVASLIYPDPSAIVSFNLKIRQSKELILAAGAEVSKSLEWLEW
jgi:hypothetical protein